MKYDKYLKDKTLKLHMRISLEEHKAVKARAKELNIPMSKLIRSLAIAPFMNIK